MYVGQSAPSTPTDYLFWFRIVDTKPVLLTNIGTRESPVWTDTRGITRIASTGVEYAVNETLGGKQVFATRFNFGALPNNTTKSATLPWQITSTWGPPQERCIDMTNTYAYTVNGDIYPLPYVSNYNQNTGIFSDGSTNAIVLELNNNIIRVRTESNRTNWFAFITIKYTKNTASQ